MPNWVYLLHDDESGLIHLFLKNRPAYNRIIFLVKVDCEVRGFYPVKITIARTTTIATLSAIFFQSDICSRELNNVDNL